jgi:hypothetical protein
MLFHGLNEVQGAGDIIVVVREGDLTAFTDGLEGGEMNDCIDGFALEDRIDRGSIKQVDLMEFQGFSSDFLDPGQGNGAGIGEIIEDDNLVSGIQKFYRGMSSNVSSATGDQNAGHAIIL